MDAEMLLDEVFICGDAEHCVERIGRLAATLGLDDFMLTFNYFTVEHERCRESMERFAAEALPRLSGEMIAVR
jgi:alkanesulfonate monooxygenase SsuD/methylene tetrahydromethanopterin reductase-like flavin-dependent oxidoreductase (luciferase family)